MNKYNIFYLQTINLSEVLQYEYEFIVTEKKTILINIFLNSPGKYMLWYSLEVPHWGTSNKYPQHVFPEK